MSLLLEWSFSRCPLKKCIFCRVDIFVRLGPDTFKYSQDHIAKKKAPVKSLHFVISRGVKAILCNSFIIDPVKASCCFSGLCHAINGGSAWFGLDAISSFNVESSFSKRLYKGTDDPDALMFRELVKEWVVNDGDWFNVLLKSIPSKSLLGACTWFHCSFCGWFHSREVSQKDISVGSWQILKPNGTCSGTRVNIKLVRSLSFRWKSLEQALDTLFWNPGNHWL